MCNFSEASHPPLYTTQPPHVSGAELIILLHPVSSLRILNWIYLPYAFTACYRPNSPLLYVHITFHTKIGPLLILSFE
jgi:hypothetical protein